MDNPIIDITQISKLKCPICTNEIGMDKETIMTASGDIFHFDCYLSQYEEHERR